MLNQAEKQTPCINVIFLDVDGVLNNRFSTSRCIGMLGIDDDKVERLAKIHRSCNCAVVLTSTWKTDWYQTDIEDLPPMGQYLVKKLHKYNISIRGKTDEDEWKHRGKGIKNWIESCDIPVKSFVILDDETFDYEAEGLMPYLVKTNFYSKEGGLQDSHVEEAIQILSKQVDKC